MLRPVVICHQLKDATNLASIGRVMANFGLDQLILSDPQTHEFRAAGRIAVKADEVMQNFAVAATLDEALKDVVYAVGSTSREQLKRFTPLSPEQAAQKLAEHASRGRVALVLGGEKRGLSDDELARCHDVVVIPTHETQPSMNLSHAAAVLIYLATRVEAGAAQPERGAPMQLVGKLEAKLKDVLLKAEFLNAQAPQHVLGEMIRSLVRKGITEREAQLWLAACEHLERHLT
ncbi:MAG: RNA methyltransferase [Archangium sp.]